MTIHLPEDVESSIQAAIHGGLFASVDDAITEAWRCLQRQRMMPQQAAEMGELSPDPLMGIWQDYAEEMDEIVEQAMRNREQQPWRLPADEAKDAPSHMPIWERILETTADIPEQEWDKLPTVLAEQHYHYLYGAPKRTEG